jgi:hypothetical protein
MARAGHAWGAQPIDDAHPHATAAELNGLAGQGEHDRRLVERVRSANVLWLPAVEQAIVAPAVRARRIGPRASSPPLVNIANNSQRMKRRHS